MEKRAALRPPRSDAQVLQPWPLANIALGVSAEDQRRAGERIPELLGAPAAQRFVSCEPLLGWLVLRAWLAKLDFVISGGENDLGDRLTHPDWQRSLRDQCAAAGVKFHLKQHGAWAAISELPKDQVSEFFDMEARLAPGPSDANCRTRLLDINGHAYRHDQLTAAAEAGAIMMLRVGTGHSGRTLDGRTHDDVLGVAHLSEGALGLKEGA